MSSKIYKKYVKNIISIILAFILIFNNNFISISLDAYADMIVNEINNNEGYEDPSIFMLENNDDIDEASRSEIDEEDLEDDIEVASESEIDKKYENIASSSEVGEDIDDEEDVDNNLSEYPEEPLEDIATESEIGENSDMEKDLEDENEDDNDIASESEILKPLSNINIATRSKAKLGAPLLGAMPRLGATDPNKGYWYMTDDIYDIEGEASVVYNKLHLTTSPKDNIPNQSGTFTFGVNATVNFGSAPEYVKHVVFESEFAPTTLNNFFGLDQTEEGDIIGFTNMEDIENIDKLDTSNVTTMSRMFFQCRNLKSLDLSTFNTSNINSFYYTFSNCMSMTNLNLSNFNTENVTDMKYMFHGCSALKNLDLSSFKIGATEPNITAMFSSLSNLETIYVTENFSGFSGTYNDTFYSCLKLAGGNGTKWVNTNTNSSRAKIDNLTQEGYFTNKNIAHKIVKDIDEDLCSLNIYRGGSNTTDYDISKVSNGQELKVVVSPTGGAIEEVKITTSSGLSATASYQSKSGNDYIYTYTIPTSGLTVGEDIKFAVTINPNKAYWYVTDASGNEGVFTNGEYNVLHLTTVEKSTIENKSGSFVFGQNPSENFGSVRYAKGVVIDTAFRPDTLENLFYEMPIRYVDGLDKVNTEDVTNMSCMFYECTALGSPNYALDLTSFKTGSTPVNTNKMFEGCTYLQTIYATSDFNNFIENNNMFNVCYISKILKGGNGTKCEDGKTGTVYAKLDNATQVGYFTDKNISHNIVKEIDNEKGSFEIRRAGSNATDYEIVRCILGQEEKIIVTPIGGYVPTEIKITTSSGLSATASYQSKSGNDYIYTYTIPTSGLTVGEDIKFAVTMQDMAGKGFWYVTNASGTPGSIYSTGYDILHLTSEMKPTEENKSGMFTFGENVGANFPNSIFSGAKKVIIDTDFSPTTLKNLFGGDYSTRYFTNVESIEGLEKINTSNVTDMSGMFSNCSKLTNVDVSSFNTTNVQNMNSLFFQCSEIQNLNLSNFNTSNVTNMAYMFGYCKNLQSLNLSNFNTAKVNDMSNMFTYCEKLSSLNVSSFNTALVTNMNSMFNDCKLLQNLNLSNFNTSNVINMTAMFHNCQNIQSLDLSNFNTSNVINMSSMFMYDNNLTTINVSSFNTELVTDMTGMFSNVSNVEEIDISSFKKNRNGQSINITKMFEKTSALKTIYASDDFTNLTGNNIFMGNGMPILRGGNGTQPTSYGTPTDTKVDDKNKTGLFTDKNNTYKISKDLNNKATAMVVKRGGSLSTTYEVERCARGQIENITVTYPEDFTPIGLKVKAPMSGIDDNATFVSNEGQEYTYTYTIPESGLTIGDTFTFIVDIGAPDNPGEGEHGDGRGGDGGGSNGKRSAKTYPSLISNEIGDKIITQENFIGPGYLRFDALNVPSISFGVISTLGKGASETINNNEEIQVAIRKNPVLILAIRDYYKELSEAKDGDDKVKMLESKLYNYTHHTLEYYDTRQQKMISFDGIYDSKVNNIYRDDMSSFNLQWIKAHTDEKGNYIWCYFDNKGKPVTGLQKIKGEYYFFNQEGKMLTGTIETDEGVFYFSEEVGENEGKGRRVGLQYIK